MLLRSTIRRSKKFDNIFLGSGAGHNETSSYDVTLVSDEQIPLQAHKVVLSACSSVLKTILLGNHHPHPLVFLRGVKYQHLRSFLEFVYQGEVQIVKEGIEEFLAVARNLGVKELNRTILGDNERKKESNFLDTSVKNEPDDVLKHEINFEDEQITDNKKKDAECISPRIEMNSPNKILSYGRIDAPTPLKHQTKDAKYFCVHCDYKSARQTHMKIHNQSVHEGIKYACNQCEYQATQGSNLKKHQQSKHDFVQLKCNRCDYAARRLDHLKIHKQAVHEGVKYSCQRCNFQTSRRGHLKEHQQAIHEGKRFTCSQCKYETKNQSNLKKHQESQHDGIRYPCDQCQYQTGWEATLRKHKNIKHGEGETKIYSCTDCNYATKDPSYLKKHKRAKHEGVKYKCNICEFSTGWKTFLRKHKKSKHTLSN